MKYNIMYLKSRVWYEPDIWNVSLHQNVYSFLTLFWLMSPSQAAWIGLKIPFKGFCAKPMQNFFAKIVQSSFFC